MITFVPRSRRRVDDSLVGVPECTRDGGLVDRDADRVGAELVAKLRSDASGLGADGVIRIRVRVDPELQHALDEVVFRVRPVHAVNLSCACGIGASAAASRAAAASRGTVPASELGDASRGFDASTAPASSMAMPASKLAAPPVPPDTGGTLACPEAPALAARTPPAPVVPIMGYVGDDAPPAPAEVVAGFLRGACAEHERAEPDCARRGPRRALGLHHHLPLPKLARTRNPILPSPAWHSS